jgi:uncharacterized protein YndB with AHSA1/START domain
MDQHSVQAKAAMLIRKPVADVFEAFVNPAITSKFWFTRGSGRLEVGKQIEWTWEMYGTSTKVDVKAIEPNKRIRVEWAGYMGTQSAVSVEWTFMPRAGAATFVDITCKGFSGTDDEIVNQVVASTGGFTIVLCGLKAYMEHGIQLNLTADRFPDAIKA